ncbi:MAG: porin [Pseudomonadota bacterium]
MQSRKLFAAAMAAALGIGLSVESFAQQGIRLSTDNLSFVEEPIAFEAGGFTILVNGLIDLSNTRDLDSDEDDGVLAGVLQLSAEKQLQNALTVGATYRGEENDGYDDQFAVYGRGVWGRVALGDVTEQTEILTERMDGVGNADMNLDNFYGDLEDTGLSYSGRFSAYTAVVSVDEDSNFDLGLVFERPLGNKDYRFAGRFINSEFVASDGTVLDSNGLQFGVELIYSSVLMDAGVGFEQLKASGVRIDRRYLAAGLSYKKHRWSFSLEGLVGDVDGEDESAYSVGARYDIARGLSVNLGLNHVDSAATIDGIQLRSDDTNEFVVSLRYEF